MIQSVGCDNTLTFAMPSIGMVTVENPFIEKMEIWQSVGTRHGANIFLKGYNVRFDEQREILKREAFLSLSVRELLEIIEQKLSQR